MSQSSKNLSAGLFHFTPTSLPSLSPLWCKPFKATNRQHEWVYDWGIEQSQTCYACYGWERLPPKWHKTGFHQDRCGHQRQAQDIGQSMLTFYLSLLKLQRGYRWNISFFSAVLKGGISLLSDPEIGHYSQINAVWWCSIKLSLKWPGLLWN